MLLNGFPMSFHESFPFRWFLLHSAHLFPFPLPERNSRLISLLSVGFPMWPLALRPSGREIPDLDLIFESTCPVGIAFGNVPSTRKHRIMEAGSNAKDQKTKRNAKNVCRFKKHKKPEILIDETTNVPENSRSSGAEPEEVAESGNSLKWKEGLGPIQDGTEILFPLGS